MGDDPGLGVTHFPPAFRAGRKYGGGILKRGPRDTADTHEAAWRIPRLGSEPDCRGGNTRRTPGRTAALAAIAGACFAGFQHGPVGCSTTFDPILS